MSPLEFKEFFIGKIVVNKKWSNANDFTKHFCIVTNAIVFDCQPVCYTLFVFDVTDNKKERIDLWQETVEDLVVGEYPYWIELL